MPANAVPARDLRSELVQLFANYCVECLLSPDKAAASTAATAVGEPTVGFSDPWNAKATGMYRLSRLIENAAAIERGRGNNLRYHLRATGQVGEATDLLADERHLDALCADIQQNVNQHVASGQQVPPSDNSTLVASALTTALLGVHSARLDGNWRGIDTVWSWCGRTLPSGYQPEGYTLLRAADYYRQLGSARLAMIVDESAQLPRPDALDELLARARSELEDSPERGTYLRRLRLFMVDAVSQLPPSELRSGSSHAEWLNKMLEGEPAQHSRFKYNLSRARFAQNRISEAIELSIDAMQSAPPSDLPYIELCRQQLLMLEQEAASRGEIARELSERIAENLQSDVQKAKDEIQAETQTIMDSSQEAIRSEVKDSLLRVVEILGVFLAVAGVAVTAVGGIAAGGSVWRALTIYGLGFLTIVLLFFILRLMVLGPLVDIRKMFGKESGKTSDPGASGPAPKAPDAT